MADRKVLNKYYPPDFDPSKVPRAKLPRDRQFGIRTMIPFNCCCNQCGEYIYKGKKFNAKREIAKGEDYLGIIIWRFYIKCPKCLNEIAFKTDLKNLDYALERGATRNFEAAEILESEEKKLKQEREDEEMNNPMKVLENRTKDSKREMEIFENLEELRDLQAKLSKVDPNILLETRAKAEVLVKERIEAEDEAEVKRILGKTDDGKRIKRIEESDEEDNKVGGEVGVGGKRPTDYLVGSTNDVPAKKLRPWEKSVGGFNSRTNMAGLVKKKVVVVKSGSEKADKLNSVNSLSGDGKAETLSSLDSRDNSNCDGNAEMGINLNCDTNKAETSRSLNSGGSLNCAPKGLSLLGSYGSESDSNESDD